MEAEILDRVNLTPQENRLPEITNLNFSNRDFQNIKITRPGPNEIHIWQIRVSSFTDSMTFFESFLSYEEKNKALRFKFDKDRERSILSRGALRYLLGLYLSRLPESIGFKYGKKGKPELSGLSRTCEFSFNISHSGDIILIAFSKYKNLGIDVEIKRNMDDCLSLAENYFHKSEWERLKEIGDLRRLDYFFRLWTGKEAYLKSTGKGIGDSLNGFYFSKLPEINSLNQVVETKIIEDKVSNIYVFYPEDGYVGAVAFSDD